MGVRVRGARAQHPQFVVFNKARVPLPLLRAALAGNRVAMGKILGYQCAGEGGGATVQYFVRVPAVEEELELYAEMCSATEVDGNRVEKQVALFNSIASPLGVTIRAMVKEPVISLVDLFHAVMKEGVIPDGAHAAVVQHLNDAGLSTLADVASASDPSKLRWAMLVTLLYIFAIDDMLMTPYADSHNTLSRELVDSLYDTFERMTPAFLTDQARVSRIDSVSDVLSAILNKQYDFLNSSQERVFQLLKNTPLVESASFMVQPWTPVMWDALYVLILAVLKFDIYGLVSQTGMRRQPGKEQAYLESVAAVLFS